MYAKITIHSIHDVRVSHTTYVELDPEDINPDTGRCDYENDLWQDAVNDYCSDTVVEYVENKGD